MKTEAGESPIQRGGRSIAIDGDFSEASGDRGVMAVRKWDHPSRMPDKELGDITSRERQIQRHRSNDLRLDDRRPGRS